MGRVVKERSVKSGLPPGTLIHIGERRAREIRVTVTDFGEMLFEEKEITDLKESFIPSDPSITSWIDVDGLHEIDVVRRLGECRGLHPLVMEDIL
ncbi:MAG TPA: magnesium and cobalt transport protein CorA, partial [Geobacteraceae bacterium]|nr:magnesium and cobalt transport protein CorA [Geobacteraceae bacterium]